MRKLSIALLGLSLASTAAAAKPDLTKEPVVAHFVIATLKGLPYPEGELDPAPDAVTLAYLATLKGCTYSDIEELRETDAVGIMWDCGPKVRLKQNGVVIYVRSGKIYKIVPSSVSMGRI